MELGNRDSQQCLLLCLIDKPRVKLPMHGEGQWSGELKLLDRRHGFGIDDLKKGSETLSFHCGKQENAVVFVHCAGSGDERRLTGKEVLLLPVHRWLHGHCVRRSIPRCAQRLLHHCHGAIQLRVAVEELGSVVVAVRLFCHLGLVDASKVRRCLGCAQHGHIVLALAIAREPQYVTLHGAVVVVPIALLGRAHVFQRGNRAAVEWANVVRGHVERYAALELKSIHHVRVV
mmetsp:Transcript_56140/g.114792  ORF Transcript_56140/g.114792 Transcript_56140/m.114792 type:complete len:231 (+) Transcript_56140:193-885(+)